MFIHICIHISCGIESAARLEALAQLAQVLRPRHI